MKPPWPSLTTLISRLYETAEQNGTPPSAQRACPEASIHCTYNVAGPMHKKVKGVSIYLPQQGIDPDYESVEFDPKWTKFLKKYADGSSADTTPPDVDDVDVSSDDDGSGGGGGGARSILSLKGITKSKDVAQVSIVLA